MRCSCSMWPRCSRCSVQMKVRKAERRGDFRNRSDARIRSRRRRCCSKSSGVDAEGVVIQLNGGRNGRCEVHAKSCEKHCLTVRAWANLETGLLELIPTHRCQLLKSAVLLF